MVHLSSHCDEKKGRRSLRQKFAFIGGCGWNIDEEVYSRKFEGKFSFWAVLITDMGHTLSTQHAQKGRPDWREVAVEVICSYNGFV